MKNNYQNNDLIEKNIIFDPIYRLKNLLRQGWLGNVAKSDIESVADHSFGVAFLALLLTPMENQLRLQHYQPRPKLEQQRILELCLLHDVAESQYLDFDQKIMELLDDQATRIKQDLEAKGITKIKKIIDIFVNQLSLEKDSINNSIYIRLQEVLDQSTTESRFVKFLDKLELNLQCQMYLKNGFITRSNANTFLKSSHKSITAQSPLFFIIQNLEDNKIILSEV